MIKKKHHHIAQVYLRKFAYADGKVWVYRKDCPRKPFSQRPEEVACRKHAHRQPKPDGGFDHNSLEDLFATVEDAWPKIFVVLRENVNPYLEKLFQFISIHRVRVPATRDACEMLLAETVRMVGRQLDREGQTPPMAEVLKRFGNSWDDIIEVSIDPHQSIHAMVPILEGMADLFERIGIGALFNDTDVQFVTSDNPVIWFDPSVLDSEMRPYTIRPDGPVMMLFPIAPNIIIVGNTSLCDQFAQYGFGYGELTDAQQVHRMNNCICRFAYEDVFAATDTFSDLVAQFSDVSPVIETRSLDADGGELLYSEYRFGPRKPKSKWKG